MMAAGPSGIQVGAGERNLSVRFAAPSFVAPEKIQLRYRLVGLEDGWLPGDVERGAAYASLPPGHYRFELQAANSDGVSSGRTPSSHLKFCRITTRPGGFAWQRSPPASCWFGLSMESARVTWCAKRSGWSS